MLESASSTLLPNSLVAVRIPRGILKDAESPVHPSAELLSPLRGTTLVLPFKPVAPQLKTGSVGAYIATSWATQINPSKLYQNALVMVLQHRSRRQRPTIHKTPPRGSQSHLRFQSRQPRVTGRKLRFTGRAAMEAQVYVSLPIEHHASTKSSYSSRVSLLIQSAPDPETALTHCRTLLRTYAGHTLAATVLSPPNICRHASPVKPHRFATAC
eukprot:4497074-Amphidinium_carterae.1